MAKSREERVAAHAAHTRGQYFRIAISVFTARKQRLEISSLCPHVAQHADDLYVIRSMQGEVANHSLRLLLTNCRHSTLLRPSLGAWMLSGLGTESDELPGYVVLTPQGMPTALSRNWTNTFPPGI